MKTRPQIAVQLIEDKGTEKKRILVTVLKDEYLEIAFAVDASEAVALAGSLTELAREARGKQIILPGGGLA